MAKPDDVQVAILETLLGQWKAQSGYGQPNGRRVFVRYVKLEDTPDGAAGWDDWSLIGFYENGVLTPADDRDPSVVAAAICLEAESGEGWVVFEDFEINWCLTNGPDGPDTIRVTDWTGAPDHA